MKIYDAHTHIFPEKIAAKASISISDFYGGAPMYAPALLEKLLSSGKKAGTEKFLVCSSAVVPKQVFGINDFIAYSCKTNPELVGLGSMHPDYYDIPSELERLKSLGLLGIKLHPDFQHFDIDSSKAMYMYSLCEKLGLSVLFHMGDNRYDYSAPKRLAAVAAKMPGLMIHAAHFGGYNAWNEAFSELSPLDNLYFDTSSSLAFIDRDTALRFIDKFGEDKFMYGTDFPMWEPKSELERLLSLGLDESVLEKILFRNFEKFYLNR